MMARGPFGFFDHRVGGSLCSGFASAATAAFFSPGSSVSNLGTHHWELGWVRNVPEPGVPALERFDIDPDERYLRCSLQFLLGAVPWKCDWNVVAVLPFYVSMAIFASGTTLKRNNCFGPLAALPWTRLVRSLC